MEVLPTSAAALAVLEVEHLELADRSRKMMAPSRGIVLHDPRVSDAVAMSAVAWLLGARQAGGGAKELFVWIDRYAGNLHVCRL